LLVLLIIKFRLFKVWKGWFLLAASMTLAISLSVFMPHLLAVIIGFIFGYLKVFRPNTIIHISLRC